MITKEKLMRYSKEELAIYILQNCFLRNVEDNLKHIHIQALLAKDQELSDKAHWDELSFLNKIKTMPGNTFEERLEKMKAWDEYKKMSKKNQAAYEKRQNEINKLI